VEKKVYGTGGFDDSKPGVGHFAGQADVELEAQRFGDLLLKESPDAPVLRVHAADDIALVQPEAK
jgi:hypothetical protein